MNDNLYYIHTIASLNFLVMLLGYFAHGIIKCFTQPNQRKNQNPNEEPKTKALHRNNTRTTRRV